MASARASGRGGGVKAWTDDRIAKLAEEHEYRHAGVNPATHGKAGQYKQGKVSITGVGRMWQKPENRNIIYSPVARLVGTEAEIRAFLEGHSKGDLANSAIATAYRFQNSIDATGNLIGAASAEFKEAKQVRGGKPKKEKGKGIPGFNPMTELENILNATKSGTKIESAKAIKVPGESRGHGVRQSVREAYVKYVTHTPPQLLDVTHYPTVRGKNPTTKETGFKASKLNSWIVANLSSRVGGETIPKEQVTANYAKAVRDLQAQGAINNAEQLIASFGDVSAPTVGNMPHPPVIGAARASSPKRASVASTSKTSARASVPTQISRTSGAVTSPGGIPRVGTLPSIRKTK